MDQPFESDVMDDLAADTPHASADESYDDYDDTEDSYDDDDAFGSDGDDYGDSTDRLADLDASFEAVIQHELADEFSPVEREGSLETAIADILGVEESAAFLRRLQQILRSSKGAAGVDRSLGHRPDPSRRNGHRRHERAQSRRRPSSNGRPQPAVIAQAVQLIAPLLRQRADETAVLEACLALAESEPGGLAIAPVVAGLSLRDAMEPLVALPRSLRRRLVQSVVKATQMLTQRHGQSAIRAIPRILAGVQHNALQQRVPMQELPDAILRITQRVAAQPELVSRLARPAQRVIRLPGRDRAAAAEQRLVFDRPVEITIRYL